MHRNLVSDEIRDNYSLTMCEKPKDEEPSAV